MSAPVGNSFSPGRPPGKPNQVTARIRDTFANILEGREEELVEALNKLRDTNPKAFLELFIKISERFVPAVTRTEHQFDEGFSPIQIVLPTNPKVNG